MIMQSQRAQYELTPAETIPHQKNEDRQKIESEVEAFLRAGGKIKKIEGTGVYVEPDFAKRYTSYGGIIK
jgi:hypothetical protein